MEFGDYVEANEDPDITNAMRGRTYASIYLGPTANLQGTKKVFDLKTGAVKKVRTVIMFPLPTRVIDLVNAWGRRYQKEEWSNKLEFLNRQKLKYDWDNDDLEYSEGIMEDVKSWRVTTQVQTGLVPWNNHHLSRRPLQLQRIQD